MRLVLASASPRRAELLSAAGFIFDVQPVDVDETPRPAESPTDYVLRVARDKAAAWRKQHNGEATACVLAADTVVVADGRILGKPSNRERAREMLTLLSGTTHLVHTGVVIRLADEEVAEVVTTRVTLRRSERVRDRVVSPERRSRGEGWRVWHPGPGFPVRRLD